MGQLFSGIHGFAPPNALSELVQAEGLQDLLSESEIALLSRYAYPVQAQLAEQPPSQLIPSNVIRIDGGEIPWKEAMVRMLVWYGHPIKQARSLADVAVALGELNETRRGRKRKGPRLYERNGWIWMTDGETRTTTGFAIDPKKDYKKNPGANAKLAALVEKRVRRILGRVLKKDVSLAMMFSAWKLYHKPGSRPRALDDENYNKTCNDLEHLSEFMATNTLDDLGWSTGPQYMEWVTARQIKSQSAQADPSEIRYIARSTARGHIQSLKKVLRWYREETGMEDIKIKVPTVRRPAVNYLTLEEIIRLISAARGKIYDMSGCIIGHHHRRAKYECVVRFIVLYVYGGTRHTNILLLTWFHDNEFGHINTNLGIIVRQGGDAEITNKRRGTSLLFGSLADLAPGWKAEDEENRKQYPGRYTHIIHDEYGLPIADLEAKSANKICSRMAALFREVRALAGLPDARPHMLKHSGVTFAVWAGMPLHEIENGFSTSAPTMWTYYVHLHPFLISSRLYDPEALKLLALRRLSPKPLARAVA